MSFDDIATAKNEILKTADLLDQDNKNMADRLRAIVGSMDTWYNTKEALFRIGGLCHPKALGDNFVTGFDIWTWYDHVANLKNVCARAFNRMERFSDEERVAFNLHNQD